MALRPCLDCKRPTKRTRFPDCERTRDRARGSRQSRGYDADHGRERQAWASHMVDHDVACRRAATGHCLSPDPLIHPWDDWHLGHPDAECSAPRAPEHVWCNTATAGRKYV